VTLVSKTRPDNPLSNEFVKVIWIGSRTKGFAEFNSSRQSACCFNGKFSPDIEDVKAVATGILRHRIIKIIKRMEGITEEMIIAKLI
jgi:MoxR-like ATPase